MTPGAAAVATAVSWPQGSTVSPIIRVDCQHFASDCKERRRYALKQRRKPWPSYALSAADEIAFGLSDIRKQAAAIGRMATSIDTMADTGIDLIRSGDLVTLERILLDVRRVTGAQAQTVAQIDGVAGMASVVLAAARRGEY